MLKLNDDIPYLRRRLNKLIEQEEYEKCAMIHKWIKEMEEETIKNQFEYIKNVLSSCENDEQGKSAFEWIWKWAELTYAKYPTRWKSTTGLFFEAINQTK